MKSKSVLVIDDEASIRKFLRIALEAQQFEVLEAESGEEGLQKLVQHKPDLLILDLGLGVLDGHEVIRKTREFSEIPIIVLTVQDDEEDKVRALDGGADDYLTKPFGVPELMARVRVALRRSQPSSQEIVFRQGAFEMD